MNDTTETSYDDEREKRIQEIQDLLFKKNSPEKIHDFLNNFFTESRNKALQNQLPKQPDFIVKPITRSKTYKREFSVKNLYLNKLNLKTTKPAPQEHKKEHKEDIANPVIQSLLNEEKTTKKKKVMKKPLPESAQAKEDKGVFIDHKTKVPEQNVAPLPEITPKKKAKKIELEKETPTKQKPTKQKKVVKKERTKPVKKTIDKNLDESFKKRQEKLSDMLNNKDEGQVT